jgi:hypothetical protein
VAGTNQDAPQYVAQHYRLGLDGWFPSGPGSIQLRIGTSSGVMRNDRYKPEVRLTDGMSLEQAMEEVRRYLEASQGNDSTHAESQLGGREDRGVSAIDDCIARLVDLADRFDYRQDTSLGFWRNLAKKVLARLFRWHIQPSQQYAWTTIAALRTIRQDLLRIQQQLSQLEERIASTKRRG